jgi:exopolyphosphatase/guanosine-5'-triphosphate,3'-diphosphate pyrophosphatase
MGPSFKKMPNFIRQIQSQKTIAAIDLGSNALRATIVRKTGNNLEVLRNFREPLRLGEEVFSKGMISLEKMQRTEEAFIHLLHAFTEYNVTDVRAYATSAMRESSNGKQLIDLVLESTGIEIQTIKGSMEASLIVDAVRGEIPIKNKTALLMDIGGGSTELTIIKDDIVLGSKSFRVGTVRLIQYKNQEELEKKIESQIALMLNFIHKHLGKKSIDLLIGTGGNLRRIGKIRKKILGKPSSELALFSEIHHMEEAIISMSYVDRIRRLELDHNRADVILPAIMLTHNLMKALKLNEVNLPRVGLKEGIILSMLDKAPDKFILKD